VFDSVVSLRWCEVEERTSVRKGLRFEVEKRN
jgi:hypothetical protein